MRWIAGCFIIFFIAGCTNRSKIPPDIIPQDKMEKIMWDMVQADRFVNSFIFTQKDTLPVKKQQAAIFYEKVFRLHGISRDEFLKSYKYYLGRPELTKLMFDSISSRADRRRADVYKSKTPGPKSELIKKRDSLKRLDSLRKQDSVDKADLDSTTDQMSDSAIRRALFK